MVHVLFVCMGNNCRSPSAEGVFRHLVTEEGLANDFHIDSCGTISHHTGDAPDSRAQATALARGIDISNLRGRQYQQSDFEKFDYIVTMDNQNYREMVVESPEQYRNKIYLFCKFAHNYNEQEVPDPYYGGKKGFEQVYDLILDASKGLLTHIRETQ